MIPAAYGADVSTAVSGGPGGTKVFSLKDPTDSSNLITAKITVVKLQPDNRRARPPSPPSGSIGHEAFKPKGSTWIWISPAPSAAPKRPNLKSAVFYELWHAEFDDGGVEDIGEEDSCQSYYFWGLENANSRLRRIVKEEDLDGIFDEENGMVKFEGDCYWEVQRKGISDQLGVTKKVVMVEMGKSGRVTMYTPSGKKKVISFEDKEDETEEVSEGEEGSEDEDGEGDDDDYRD